MIGFAILQPLPIDLDVGIKSPKGVLLVTQKKRYRIRRGEFHRRLPSGIKVVLVGASIEAFFDINSSIYRAFHFSERDTVFKSMNVRIEKKKR